MMRPDGAFEEGSESDQASAFLKKYRELEKVYQTQLDRLTPYTFYRWMGTVALLMLFILRILLSQGWYIVTYALGIYLLNLFLSFLQPKFDPSLEQDIAENEDLGHSCNNLLLDRNVF
ncbi:Rer1 family-domain-containing protein [Phakopsora pachyrhizi]|uniref:Rer1 family-domain-containing protein n=1 Tax=Phakopsora pachyrhizi TaxID=170000 RepID=A0AAV0BRB5_PHAPC|nr:Rer1 family-domain-containing protein [Phakopsora pachyrhizi]